jgi:hypothetical protein
MGSPQRSAVNSISPLHKNVLKYNQEFSSLLISKAFMQVNLASLHNWNYGFTRQTSAGVIGVHKAINTKKL